MLLANPQTIVSQPTILSAREEAFSYLHLVRRHFTWRDPLSHLGQLCLANRADGQASIPARVSSNEP